MIPLGTYNKASGYNPQQQGGNIAGILQPSYNNNFTGVGRAVQPAAGGLQVTENPYNYLAAQPAGASAQPASGAYSGGGWGAAASRATQEALRSFDQQIARTQSAINRLDSELNSGFSTIDASYQNALNQLLGGKNQAERNYGDNVNTTRTNYIAGKNTVGANAGNTLNSLQRLLGARGAGGSSAYSVTAPQTVSRQATLQRGDLANTFGSNMKSLDQAWGDFLQGYENQVSSAKSQREQQRNELQRSIDRNKASLLESLASLAGQRAQATGGSSIAASQPYLNQADAILNSIANYTVAPISYKLDAYKAPSLASYTTNPNAAPTYQGQKSTTDYFSPYLAALLGKKQQNLTAG